VFGVFGLGGCAGDPDQVPPVDDGFHLSQLGLGQVNATGMSKSAATGNLWFLVQGVGLVETTPAGALVSTLPFGNDLTDLLYTDLAVLGDGTFALTSNGEAYRYTPGQGIASYFCLVPGWEETQMENQAVALDPLSGTIYVAPRYFTVSTGETVSSRHEAYASTDGHWMSGVDVMATGIVAQGMAVDHQTSKLWVVEGDRLYRFSLEGGVEAEFALEGIGEATGMSLDGDELTVVDATGNVRRFSRATFVSGGCGAETDCG
jgi:hypothetical protein